MSGPDLAAGPVRTVHQGPFELAEGPFWHPDRGRLFWFSILEGTLHSIAADGSDHAEWRLGERASAAGMVDRDRLVVATETGVWLLDLVGGAKTALAPLEAGDPRTRSNDGRVAPDGSFWIGTMGLDAETGMGGVYRYVADAMPPIESVRRNVSIPNSTCFSPDGQFAYLSDTREQMIRRIRLDPATGAPRSDADPFIDLSGSGLNPDGAVTDAEGAIWCAMFGAGEVVRFSSEGERTGSIAFPATQLTCPAFGGPDGTTLFVTSAWEHMAPDERGPQDGAIYAVDTTVRGAPEPRVRVPA